MFCVGGKEIEMNAFGIFSSQEIIGKIKEDSTKEDWGGEVFFNNNCLLGNRSTDNKALFFLPLRLSPLFDQ